MMLADVCIPEGIVAAGVGEMVLSLLFGGSSSSSSSPSPTQLSAQQLVDAVELGSLSMTCTLQSNSVQDVGSPVVGAQNTEFDPRVVRSIWKNHIFALGYSRLVGDLKHFETLPIRSLLACRQSSLSQETTSGQCQIGKLGLDHLLNRSSMLNSSCLRIMALLCMLLPLILLVIFPGSWVAPGSFCRENMLVPFSCLEAEPRFAQDCIQTYAQTTFLKSTSDFVGSFSPQCKSTCGTEDAYNQHYTACSGGAQQLNQWLTTWESWDCT